MTYLTLTIKEVLFHCFFLKWFLIKAVKQLATFSIRLHAFSEVLFDFFEKIKSFESITVDKPD